MQENVKDDELITAFLRGDHKAFEELYKRHKKPLLSVINGFFMPDYATADDVFQQTWLHIIEHLPRYQDQSYFLAWACAIARNLSINILRKRKQTQKLFIDEYDEALSTDYTEESLEEEYDVAIYSQVELAIQDLNPLQKEVLVLRKQSIPFSEIAIVQNCSLNTVLGRHHDAIANIRKKLNISPKGVAQ